MTKILVARWLLNVSEKGELECEGMMQMFQVRSLQKAQGCMTFSSAFILQLVKKLMQRGQFLCVLAEGKMNVLHTPADVCQTLLACATIGFGWKPSC